MKTLPRLHIVGPLNGVVTGEEFIRIGAAAAESGECAIHVRVHGAHGGDVFDVARQLKANLIGTSSQVIVNDRVDVALAASASGVQLGERSLPVLAARRMMGNSRLIGRSVHDVAGARQAVSDGADFLIAGHVFDTESKQDEPGRGLEWLNTICQAALAPVVAIGGITLERIDDVMDAGVWGVAVGRDVLLAGDPGLHVSELLERINERVASNARNFKADQDNAKWIVS